jgi:NAD(P)H-hydrate epimerase
MIRLTREQVREIDQRSIEEYHIPGIVLMENAARAAAEVAHSMIERPTNAVTIFCGNGNNGGDGLAIARHLHNRGHEVSIHLLASPDRFKGDALTNWQIIQAMKIPVAMKGPDGIDCGSYDLIIDALLGTGLESAPRAEAVALVEAINRARAKVLAVDLPSGMNCDTGMPMGACAKATRTVTFVAEKIGFANPESKQFTGDVIVADIGCPRELVEEIFASTR